MKVLFDGIRTICRGPGLTLKLLRRSLPTARGFSAPENFTDFSAEKAYSQDPANPLQAYFDAYTEGPGIWKFNHYFDIYHRHFAKFRSSGKPVHILEIGIYSGGSLRMWKDYFGPNCTVYGVDIAPECEAYKESGIQEFIGDQGDRSFWKRFKSEVPHLDIVIDDGAHSLEEQIVTLEELLPFIRPGGVFLCEDLHGKTNWFAAYCHGLSDKLNEATPLQDKSGCRANGFQEAIHSVHHYPYVVVIEKREHVCSVLRAPKHGTEWQPFYKVEAQKS